MQTKELEKYQFQFVTDVRPENDQATGKIKKYLPHLLYKEAKTSELLRYGEGPFVTVHTVSEKMRMIFARSAQVLSPPTKRDMVWSEDGRVHSDNLAFHTRPQYVITLVGGDDNA